MHTINKKAYAQLFSSEWKVYIFRKYAKVVCDRTKLSENRTKSVPNRMKMS